MASDSSLYVSVRVDGPSGQQPRLDLELQFAPEPTALLGPSGAGKSTLLACVAGLLHPHAGTIRLGNDVFFDSQARVFIPPHARRVGLMLQTSALFPHLSVEQNVAFGIRERSSHKRREQVRHWLERTRALHLMERAPRTLSGGETQRVALARALATSPRILLLDEPFASLDPSLRIELGELIFTIGQELAIPILLVTHNRAEAARLTTRAISLENGRRTSEGP